MIDDLFYTPVRGNNKHMVSLLDIISSNKELSDGIKEIKNEYEPILNKVEEISQEPILDYQRIIFYFLLYQHKKGEIKNDRRRL